MVVRRAEPVFDQYGAPAAGGAYFALVFGFGFLLGTLRTLVVVPRIGETTAVLLELPVILAISWLASRWSIAKFGIPRRLGVRLAMGGMAFGLTMLAEAGVSHFVFGRSFAEHIGAYRSASALAGLFGQVLFGLFPAIQVVCRGDAPPSDGRPTV